MRAKKSLGQNFLMHRQIAERMVLAAGITPEDTVLEIGPGKGLLTRELLKKANRVVAIEADEELIPVLHEAFESEISAKRLTIIHGDVRKFDCSHVPNEYKIVANIPYYITGEIFRYFLSSSKKPVSMTLLVQKEVAERIARSSKESLLSISVKAYGTPKYCFTVPRGAFVPAPNVDSAVLSVENIHSPFKNTAAEALFFELLHAGFGHKRKQLQKNLEPFGNQELILDILSEHNLPKNVRAEDVSLDTWVELSKALKSNT